MTIAVTGATGGLGGCVARGLAERGVRPRLIVRDPARAPQLPGADIAVAAYQDAEAMARALEGTTTLFLVSGHEDPDRVSLHRKALEGARLAARTSAPSARPRTCCSSASAFAASPSPGW